ncbi:MAG: hypothetical protein V7L00_29590 [Nostoc sp.]|uniref:hypothetical protein n=1 Tax=Nostoc sp. TaxID=1180 RepID=UPI002FF60BD7
MIILTANCVRHSGQQDHQTGVLTQELIDGYGLLPQQILCEAIADYHSKIKSKKKSSPRKRLLNLKWLWLSRGCTRTRKAQLRNHINHHNQLTPQFSK